MATILTTTQVYNAADVVTHTNLNQIIGGSTFVAGVGGATDDVTLEVDSGTGSLQVKEIDTDQIKDASVTTAKLASATLTAIYDAVYPVGSIYMNFDTGANPGTLLGFGTWVAFGEGRVPAGYDSTDSDFFSQKTGGAKTHTLTEAEMPSHTHTYSEASSGSAAFGGGAGSTGVNLQTVNSGSTGGDSAHNNLQPYIVVYMWKRTA